MTPDLQLLPEKIPLSLYIHIPWCVKKCPYCDFNSHALPDKPPFKQYVDALMADIDGQLALTAGRSISSIFIGGGTPSLLPTDEMARLFAHLRQRLAFDEDCEITLECNPGTLEHAPFDEYLQIGINRLSIGVQTFDENTLKTLGRVHNSEQAIQAVQSARQAGFSRVNADLMYGLPDQSVKHACDDILTAINAGATHISWYQLTIEPNTAFYRLPPELPHDDLMEDIETAGREILLNHGFNNYEISAWAGKNDTPCRHNLNYWQFGDYLAIGAGAHGKVTLKNHAHYPDGVYRFQKSRLPKDYLEYLDTPKMVNFGQITEENLPFEFMMNALRLADGVTTEQFEQRTGLFVSTIDNEMMPLQHQGLMVFDPLRIAPTALGFRYVNHLVRAFLP